MAGQIPWLPQEKMHSMKQFVRTTILNVQSMSWLCYSFWYSNSCKTDDHQILEKLHLKPRCTINSTKLQAERQDQESPIWTPQFNFQIQREFNQQITNHKVTQIYFRAKMHLQREKRLADTATGTDWLCKGD